MSNQELRERARLLLEKLPELQQQIIRLRYGLDDGVLLEPNEVAERLGLTQDEILRLERQAVSILCRE